MATEPNNAEERLKQYAAARRGAAPTEMHPATRRILDGEVARVYRAAGRGAIPWWRKYLISPQVGWAAGLAAIFGLSLLALNRPPTGEAPEGARETEAISVPAKAAAPKQSEPAPPPPARAEGAAVLDRAEPKANAEKPAAREVSRAAPAPVELKKEATQQRSLRPMPAAPPAPAAVAPPASSAVGEGPVRLSNQAPPAGDERRKTGVLDEFVMRRSGMEVRFVDSDQSTYNGRLEALAGGTNSFRATGTNRTLREAVVFTGQVVQGTGSAAGAPGGQVGLASGQVRVQGRAQVGPSNQIQIDAKSTPQR